MKRARVAVAAAACALLAACVQLDWTAVNLGEPPSDAALARVAAGAPAQAAFEALGAPDDVWELEGGGVACLWVHERERDVGVGVSVAIEDSPISPSLDVGDDRSRARGVLVLLDAAWRVDEVREGRLAELAPRRRWPLADDGALGRRAPGSR